MPGTFTLPLYEVLDIEKDTGTGLRIGLNDYPIFDPAYRDDLNQKIIRHYYNREIGLETISMFTFALKRKMWEIMPLYNQVYLSTKMEFDPFSTIDVKTLRTDNGTEHNHGTGTNNGTTDSTTAATAGSNSGSRTVHSETPQTQLSADEDYATSADDATSATQTTNSGTQHATNVADTTNTVDATTENSVDSHTTGYQAIPSDLLLKYRATLLNVDMMVVNELGELFMGIWGTPEEMAPQKYRALGWIY